jgi:hypothetical protein
VLPQVVVSEKLVGFVPVMVMPVMFNTASPVFESVMVCAALVVPIVVFAKATLGGESAATGPEDWTTSFTIGDALGALEESPL